MGFVGGPKRPFGERGGLAAEFSCRPSTTRGRDARTRFKQLGKGGLKTKKKEKTTIESRSLRGPKRIARNEAAECWDEERVVQRFTKKKKKGNIGGVDQGRKFRLGD